MHIGHSCRHASIGSYCGRPTILLRHVVLGSMLMTASACHDLSGLAGTQQLPAGIPNPAVYHTAAGALALYQTTVGSFQYANGVSTTSIGAGITDTTNGAFVDFVLGSGLLTDELQAGNLGCNGISCTVQYSNDVDARQLPEDQGNSLTDNLYNELQGIRNDAAIGIGALATYDSAASPALRGHLYALAGYAELFLADLYCSGVPLSTINFNGTTSYTYAAGSTTAQMYQDALAKFDTAIAVSSDSARILNLARVGKGRALLALDSLPQAAQAVASVPDGFTYQFLVDWSHGQSVGQNLFTSVYGGATVADQEGLTGLPFISSGDPRTVSQVASTNSYGVSQYVPLRYGGATPGIFPITVADWIEARLIRAEAALHAGDITGWLSQLNYLREHAMTPALSDTTDPGTDKARVSLLFHERAYWLFVSGHRQGDLRRLIRQYSRQPDQVYPTGLYPLLQLGTYGGDVTAPIPTAESVNPLFHGCLSRGA